MIIVHEDHQNLDGLSDYEIALIKSIRLLAQWKIPNCEEFSKRTIVEFNRNKMLFQNMADSHINYLKIHHRMFNKDFSIKILLKVKSFFSNYSHLRPVAYCWRFKKDYYKIIFELKNGKGQQFTLHADMKIVDDFLKRNILYEKLIYHIQRELFYM